MPSNATVIVLRSPVRIAVCTVSDGCRSVGEADARLLVEEAEVELDVVGEQVVVQVRREGDDLDQHGQLERDAQHAHVAPQRWP